MLKDGSSTTSSTILRSLTVEMKALQDFLNLWKKFSKIFRTHPAGKMRIFRTRIKELLLFSPSNNHVNILVDICLWTVHNSNPGMLQSISSSFENLNENKEAGEVTESNGNKNKKFTENKIPQARTSSAFVPLSIKSSFVNTPNVLSPEEI